MFESTRIAGDPAGTADEFGEPEVELGEELTDAIDQVLESFEALVGAINRADGTGMFGHFRAYHMADLEGSNGGWLGGPHLVDVLREMKEGKI